MSLWQVAKRGDLAFKSQQLETCKWIKSFMASSTSLHLEIYATKVYGYLQALDCSAISNKFASENKATLLQRVLPQNQNAVRPQ